MSQSMHSYFTWPNTVSELASYSGSSVVPSVTGSVNNSVKNVSVTLPPMQL